MRRWRTPRRWRVLWRTGGAILLGGRAISDAGQRTVRAYGRWSRPHI